MANAEDAEIKKGVRTLLRILGHCLVEGCDGHAIPMQPPVTKAIAGEIHQKIQCNKCQAVDWVDAPQLLA